MALLESTFPPYVPFGGRTLSGGEVGSDVAILQIIYNQSIAQMNQPGGPLGPTIPVTGRYDAATVQAVRNVQTYFAIAVDGVVGPDTYFVFGQGVSGHVTYGGPRYGSRSLSQGDTGGDVTVLQNRLNLFRYSTELGGPADGIFGPKTAAAVLAFKQDAIANGDTGLDSTAVVGNGTFGATWIYTYAGGRGLFSGRNGFDVVFIQVLLANLGIYTGSINGYYDAGTIAAVRAFQTANGIGVDGVVGQVTYYTLGRHNVVVAPSPYPVPPIVPTPSEIDCCFTLAATAQAMGLARGVFFIHNGPQSGPSSAAVQWIVSALMAPPSQYGSSYTAYGYRLGTSGSYTPMSMCTTLMSGNQVWSDAFISASAGPVTQATVQVAPLKSSGQAGAVVLQGSGTCPFDSMSGGGGNPWGGGGGCDDADATPAAGDGGTAMGGDAAGQAAPDAD